MRNFTLKCFDVSDVTFLCFHTKKPRKMLTFPPFTFRLGMFMDVFCGQSDFMKHGRLTSSFVIFLCNNRVKQTEPYCKHPVNTAVLWFCDATQNKSIRTSPSIGPDIKSCLPTRHGNHTVALKADHRMFFSVQISIMVFNQRAGDKQREWRGTSLKPDISE